MSYRKWTPAQKMAIALEEQTLRSNWEDKRAELNHKWSGALEQK